MKFVVRTLVVAVGALLVAHAAMAHAMLDHATPAVGSTVHGAPAKVELWFTEELEPAFSSIKVTDANGNQVDRQDKATAPGDNSRLSVSLPALQPGAYKVAWRAVSVDTHVTEGDYMFEVAP